MNENSVSPNPKDNWASGDKYEPYIGRWSRRVAREFLNWLAVPAGSAWLDVGCGTGALSQTILQFAEPGMVRGIDRSEGFVAFAKEHTQDSRVQFDVGDAMELTADSGTFDATVSGLVLNFIPQPERTATEMARVTRSGGVSAAYVWDYAGRMQLIRHFFDAAIELDPKALQVDEGPRFPICQPDVLARTFEAAGLHQVEVRPIEIPTVFRNFDDYWSPFLGGQGPAPSYAISLSEEHRAALRERLRARLPFAPDGSISLVARAWAVRGYR
ncbi:MAG: methyltransferase domain-containing protein [Chloroflexi bacterium]|nr:methyltransferase domain-containing protein [Chloroflexota bacterium]MBI3167312.1 methyltransferase domain-containing protein [Chloroflexota bacterium]